MGRPGDGDDGEDRGMKVMRGKMGVVRVMIRVMKVMRGKMVVMRMHIVSVMVRRMKIVMMMVMTMVTEMVNDSFLYSSGGTDSDSDMGFMGDGADMWYNCGNNREL